MSTLTPGEYTKAELQKILGASSKTVDRYRKRFKLPDKEGPSQAIRIVVNEEAARLIREFVSSRAGQDYVNDIDSPEGGKVNVMDMSIIRELESKLHEIEKEKIRLEGNLNERNTLLSSKDEIIKAKQSEIDTLKTSLFSVEKTVQNLQTAMLVLERDNQRMSDHLKPPIPMITTTQKPQTFWERFRFLFGKS
jgi:hypothetical protein